MSEFVANTYQVIGANNPGAQVSATRWNGLLSDLGESLANRIRRYEGAVNPHWFGVLATNTAAQNVAAWNAMMTTLRQLSKSVNESDSVAIFYRSLRTIRFPDDLTYLFNAPLDLMSGSIEIIGCGPATITAGTTMKWANSSSGFRVQRADTEGSSGVRSPTGTGADGSTFRMIRLDGGYTSGVENDYHAIEGRAAVHVDDCWIGNWGAGGVYCSVDAVGVSRARGNANLGYIGHTRFENCRWGVRLDGPDANCWLLERNDYSACRQWGEWVSSLLSCTSLMAHEAEGGITPFNDGTTVPVSIVHHSGRRFYVRAGQAAGASTNAPPTSATSNTWWGYLNDLGVASGAPAWFSGISCREGGSFRYEGTAAQHVLLTPYSEGGTPPASIDASTTIWNGQLENGVVGAGLWVRNNAGAMRTENLVVSAQLTAAGTNTKLGPSSGSARDNDLYFANTNAATTLWFSRFDAAGSRIADDGYLFVNVNSGGHMLAPNYWRFRTGTVAVPIEIFEANSSGLDLASGKVLKVNGTQVVAARGAAVADATGGGTVDTEARAAINALLARCRAHGLIAS